MNRMMSATIRGGVAVSDDFADLPDGTAVAVAVIAPDDDFELTSEQDAALVAAVEEADRGDTLIPAEEVMRRLDARRQARLQR